MGSPPYVVVLGSLKSFGVLKSSTTYALEARISFDRTYRRRIRDLLVAADGQPEAANLSTLVQSSRRAKGSPQVRELAARSLLRGLIAPQIVEVFLFVPQQTSTDLRDARSNPTRLFIV
jgi:hypothetical protein